MDKIMQIVGVEKDSGQRKEKLLEQTVQAHQQLMELLMEMQNSLKGEEKD